MANLFRCVPNLEKREYILKAGGIVQGSYSYKTYTHKMEEGTYNYSASWAEATYYAICAVYYRFNATKWNKIHIKRLYGAGFNNVGLIGVLANPDAYLGASDFEYASVQDTVYPHGEKDYVLDISNMTGDKLFFIYAKTTGYTTSSYTSISIRGDVYLSEK